MCVGIEVSPDIAREASHEHEKVHVDSLDQEDFLSGIIRESFYCINLGDVLEHLQAPASVLKTLATKLRAVEWWCRFPI
ncbi:MAG: 2-polyprenyl-3-methyl-5-hydroxy-6-metoxy-1,4-benzoquinol methylase [Candidatus Pelagisphaera sp.]